VNIFFRNREFQDKRSSIFNYTHLRKFAFPQIRLMKKMEIQKKQNEKSDNMPYKRASRPAFLVQGTEMQTLPVIGFFDDPAGTSYRLRHTSSLFLWKFGGFSLFVKA